MKSKEELENEVKKYKSLFITFLIVFFVAVIFFVMASVQRDNCEEENEKYFILNKLPSMGESLLKVIFLDDVNRGDYVEIVGAINSSVIAIKTEKQWEADVLSSGDYEAGDYGFIVIEQTRGFGNIYKKDIVESLQYDYCLKNEELCNEDFPHWKLGDFTKWEDELFFAGEPYPHLENNIWVKDNENEWAFKFRPREDFANQEKEVKKNE